jgi:hypothetical protein
MATPPTNLPRCDPGREPDFVYVCARRRHLKLPRPRPDTITLDRYGHLMPGNEEEAAGLLDVYLARANDA